MAYERREHGQNYGAYSAYDGGPGRLPGQRKRPVTDYGSTMVQFMRHRRRIGTTLEQERPSHSYIVDMLPPRARLAWPADTIPVKLLHSSLNKARHPINVVKWTPDGRRLLTGSSSGEFTLWNGMGFNFETIMSAHSAAIRAIEWSHSGDWLISAAQDGFINYYQPNLNEVKRIERAHDSPIRDLAFAPNDSKFVSASDDATMKIWDFSRAEEDLSLTGHGWDVKTVDWHPTKGLLASGSKDHQVKLWDPRTGRCLTTLHGHKNTLARVAFENTRGQALATCAKDSTARIFDLRMMRDVLLLRGHERDLTTIVWHPVHPSMISTGDSSGCINHYILDDPNAPDGNTHSLSVYDHPDPQSASIRTIYPSHRVPHAHETAVWSLDWHPIGHILASGSNDKATRFWTRPRPGESDCFTDKYHLGEQAATQRGTYNKNQSKWQARHDEEQELEDEADGLVDQKAASTQLTVPGLPGIGSAVRRDGTSVGGAQQVPAQYNLPGFVAAPPPVSSQIPNYHVDIQPQVADAARLQELMAGHAPPYQQYMGGPNGYPPMPNYPGTMANTAVPSYYQPQQPVPGMPGYYPPYQQQQIPGFTPDLRTNSPDGIGSTNGVRKRAPLPSQKESMREELRRNQHGRQR